MTPSEARSARLMVIDDLGRWGCLVYTRKHASALVSKIDRLFDAPWTVEDTINPIERLRANLSEEIASLRFVLEVMTELLSITGSDMMRQDRIFKAASRAVEQHKAKTQGGEP